MIGEFQQYEPAESVWVAIDSELNLHDATANLPHFSPPFFLWEQIGNDLDNKSHVPQSKTIKLLLRWSVAAAAIVVLGMIAYYVSDRNNEQISYSEEWTVKHDLAIWQDDDALIDEAITLICREKPEACRTPEFKKMEKELAFLDQSKRDILNSMNPYDNEKELALMLTKIELERTDIINQMATLIN